MRPPRLVALALIVAFAATAGSAQDRVATAPTTAPAGGQREDLVAWITIGGSNEDQSRRQVGWKLELWGWRGFIQRVVDPAVRHMRLKGFKPRIVVCNPFGTLEGEVMQFDQRLHAEAGVKDVHAPLPWLYDGFEEAWSSYLKANPDVEAICYLGTLDGDPDFAPFEKPGDPEKWLARFWSSVRPALAAGMAVGFDASANVKSESPAWAAMQLVRNLGTKVYVEARPTQRHLAGWPVIAIDTTYERTDPERFPEAAALGQLKNDQLGRTMLLITAGTVQEKYGRAMDHIAAGHDISVPHSDLEWAIKAIAAAREREGK